MTRRLVVLALGESDAEAASLVRERFSEAEVVWVERSSVRAGPLAALRELASRRSDDALLVVGDLAQRRVRLTGLLLALPRARRRWIADRAGRLQPFSWQTHVRQHGWPLARHLAALVLAALAARPCLTVGARLLERKRGRRPLRDGAPRRVLYLRSQFWFHLQGGGSVAHTAGVIQGLRENGADVEVVTTDVLRGVPARQHLARPEQWFDGRLKEVEELAFNGPFTLRALRVALQWRPDLIYQRFTALNVSGAILSRLLGVPLVLEFNSSDVWKGQHWGELRLLSLAKLGERLSLRAADRVVVVSRVLRDAHLALGVPEDRIVVNPNGVDPSRFQPGADGRAVRERHALQQCVVVGFSGTFGVWHGIPTLGAAIPLVAAARPNVRFLLVGDGPLRHSLEQQVRDAGVERRVEASGLVAHELMPEYLAACDILLSPHGRQADGREFFGSPTKLFEYLAAGRAIVASGIGQIAEVLEHEQTALLVPPDDPRALAEAVIRLVDDAPLRARLGRAARMAAEQRHTWQQNAARALAGL